MGRCKECGGKLELEREGLIYCKNCGLVDDLSPIDLSSKPVSKERLKRQQEKVPEKKWSKDTYSRNIKHLNILARQNLPTKFAETLVHLFKEVIKLNYKHKIPRTRDKKVIAWTVFISLIEYSIKFFEKSDEENKKEIISGCNAIIQMLMSENPSRFRKVSSLISQFKALTFIDVEGVDKNAKYTNNKQLFNLFYKTTPKISNSNKNKNIEEVVNAGKIIANICLKREVDKHIANKDKKKAIRKSSGLLGVACYMVCKHNRLEPKSQPKWAKFFHISESSFDKLYKQLKKA